MSLALDAAIAANRHFSTVMSRRSLNPAAFPPQNTQHSSVVVLFEMAAGEFLLLLFTFRNFLATKLFESLSPNYLTIRYLQLNRVVLQWPQGADYLL